MLFTNEFLFTSGVLLMACGGFAWLSLRDRRPRESFDTPLLPTTPLLLISGIVALIALVHLVNLLGFRTGQ